MTPETGPTDPGDTAGAARAPGGDGGAGVGRMGTNRPPLPSSFNILGSLGTRRPWLQHRRGKVLAEIERNRRGEYKVPTWVMVAVLVVIVVGFVAIIATG